VTMGQAARQATAPTGHGKVERKERFLLSHRRDSRQRVDQLTFRATLTISLVQQITAVLCPYTYTR